LPDVCTDDGPDRPCDAGGIDVGVYLFTTSYNIDNPSDHDYLSWNVRFPGEMGRGHDVTVGLANIPPDANYDLDVIVECDNSTALGDTVCIQGTPFPPTNPAGCASSNPGNTNEMIVARTNCVLQNIIVHVAPIATGPICENYMLTLNIQSNGATEP
jgi:hypothetical protein